MKLAKNWKKQLLQTLALFTILTVAVYAVVTNFWIIRNEGKIKTVGIKVYTDLTLTTELTLLRWGAIEPNTTTTKNMCVHNAGNSNATLNMTLDNWVPQNFTNFAVVTWDREGYMLGPGASVEATVTLFVNDEIQDITDFRFDITLWGISEA